MSASNPLSSSPFRQQLPVFSQICESDGSDSQSDTQTKSWKNSTWVKSISVPRENLFHINAHSIQQIQPNYLISATNPKCFFTVMLYSFCDICNYYEASVRSLDSYVYSLCISSDVSPIFSFPGSLFHFSWPESFVAWHLAATRRCCSSGPFPQEKRNLLLPSFPVKIQAAHSYAWLLFTRIINVYSSVGFLALLRSRSTIKYIRAKWPSKPYKATFLYSLGRCEAQQWLQPVQNYTKNYLKP